MIIIEGPDHVGKTTAAKRLCELSGMKYSHMGVPPDDWDWHDNFLEMVQPYIVQDRFHLGGIAYGIFADFHECGYTVQSFYDLLAQLHSQTFIVIMTCDWSWLQERFGEKEEEYDTMDEVWEGFHAIISDRCFLQQPMYDITYNVTQGFPDDKELESWITQHKNKLSKVTENFSGKY